MGWFDGVSVLWQLHLLKRATPRDYGRQAVDA